MTNDSYYLFEKIMFENSDFAHSLHKIDFNKKDNCLVLTLKSDIETEVKIFRIHNVSNFQYDIEDKTKYNDWPRPIIGIDTYPQNDNIYKIVINCGDIEFSFITTEKPKKTK